MTNVTLTISAFGPTIKEQCEKLGLTPTDMSIELVDLLNHGLSMAYVYGLLTEREIDRARHRLLKAAKFVKVAKT